MLRIAGGIILAFLAINYGSMILALCFLLFAYLFAWHQWVLILVFVVFVVALAMKINRNT